MKESGTVLRHLTVIDDKPQNNYSYNATTSSNKKKKVFKDNVNVSHITQGTAQALLKHAVITLAAHIGYEKASDSAISLLTDVAEYFLKRICLLLKVSSEQTNYGFPVNIFIFKNVQISRSLTVFFWVRMLWKKSC